MIKPDKNNCSGCGVCEYVCSHSAITTETDSFGFIYPKVNSDKCVDCGLCDNVCPFNVREEAVKRIQKTYAVRHKDSDVVRRSRSGGFFTAISDSILRSGGIVYGAILDHNMKVVHLRADSSSDRDRMRGSKYSQSNLGDICVAVRKDLMTGKNVLFSGTPCQVEAISRFIGKKLSKNLVTVDIICHGVGSPEIWKRFIKHIEKAEGRKIINADFRDKRKYGWNGLHKESFLLEDETERKYYPYIYYSDLHVRESCRNCPYACLPRRSDITLGDLWGFENVVPEWSKDNDGISLVLVNSDKGRMLMNDCVNSVEAKEIDLSKVMQPHLQHPIRFDEARREEYANDFSSMDFESVLKKYHKVERPSFPHILWNKVKILIKR